MAETRFTKDHEWVRLDGKLATIGITAHAQEQLGDLVFIELPEIGRHVDAGEACAVVESVKAASDIYAPMAGRVAEVNPAVTGEPALVNRDPAEAGWLFRLEVEEPASFDELMDEKGYAQHLETL